MRFKILCVATLTTLVGRVAYAQEPPAEGKEAAEEEVVDAIEQTPDPTRAPPRGKGAVWGVVKSRKDAETIVDALLSVIGRSEKTNSDVDGRYRFELPPGTYQVRVQAELHKPARVKNVRIVAGKVSQIDVTLDPDETAVEEVTAVEAEVERSSAATQLFLRKNAAQASDSIGAQDIAKAPDRNAADAVKRVVGTTVVDGRYIFIRGLGDRYTNSLLNGSPLPSPEPDRQAVPLDMFPTLVISDLTVSKTFVPDMPGDFTGGSLDIHTRDMPNKLLVQATIGAGFNTVSTFTNRLSYPGGSTDWLGIDDGGRKLPAEVPAEKVTRFNPNLTNIGRAVNTEMESDRAFNLPNGTGSAVVGNSWKLGKDQKHVIGTMGGFTYTRRFQRRVDEIIRTYGAPQPGRGDELTRFNDYRAETGIDTVTWSGLGTVSYGYGTDHKIALTGLYSRNAEKEARFITGFNDEQNNDVRDERLRFVNRAMIYGQLRGDHRFPSLNSGELTWNALWARATLNDPNLRETVYMKDSPEQGGGFSFRESTQSGQHFYAAQGETTRSGGVNWTQPITKFTQAEKDRVVKLKTGALVTLRGRSFNARRFNFLDNNALDPAIFRQRPNQLFTDQNVGRFDDNNALELNEWTNPTDAYAAQYNVYAGYLMSDVPITSRLRFVAGERVEVSRQIIQSYDPFGSTAENVESKLNKTDLLPSGNIIFKVTEESNLRFSATRTVARPQLREMAPFVFTEFFGAREILGNPNLDRTRIINLDARYELFPKAGEVIAISAFHKDFDKPIEQVILPTSRGVISYQNAKGAVNTGLEAEARKSLDFISRYVKDFSVLGNVTVVYSRVDLDQSQIGVQTSNSRPLAGQSPYVINLALDWNREASKSRARILYNTSGPRIASVGSNGLPDVYEQPRHLVDLSFAQGIGDHIDLKATIENLLDSPVRFTQGEDGRFLTNRYNVGSTFWLMASYNH